ncbi:uncharacterized protein BX663DRAFT_39360 [Cokeromyces recurvatus]|uniref:uncharacterized protein n=1 Tax=Cokeromyces recurvatus TaxID=90255 RepID=UPI00222008C2|nr:uncharacterized protein BX663DRAFT_39360 [Cokeromyces recurvatus]KAI7903727.1 hypothetical protein BX663DRAFT_39360 [Cokeromyces recurvatus]
MEHISTKLFTQMTHYPQREMALKLELLQYKTESIEMQIWKKKRQRDEDPEQISNSKLQYQNQLNEQVKFYQSEIEQQSILIQRDQQLCQRLENDCERLETENNRLEQVLKEKSRILDTKDNKITQLNNEITNCQYNPNSSKIKENKMKQDFEIKDKNWASHTAQMEDKFDLLLDNFDKLTNKAIEFDSHRMKYDRTIEELNKTIYQLELELMNEKVEKIGYGGNFNSDSPATTVGLRKEFRILVADIKRTHQLRMEQEAEEIQRLKVQIEELQRSNNVTFQYKQRNDMAIQTEAYTNN